MAIPDRKKLASYFAELMRVEESRSLKAEREIQKLYKEMLTDLQGYLGVEYAKHAVDDRLTYTILAQKNEYARFLEEVQKKVNNIVPKVNATITSVVKDTYRTAYEGMVSAVKRSANNTELEKLLGGIHLTQSQVIKAAVENPVNKLTLPKTLEKNRKTIVYNIKSTVTTGIMNGDRMSTMAQRIQQDVDQNYRKAMLIARTEVHRVRETGHNNASADIDDTLIEAESEFRMVKIWKNMQDSSVRKTSKADHRVMEGQTVLQDEDFDLGRGVTAPCPGQSGTAYNDCNCRCYVSHDLMDDEEFFEATGRHFPEVEKPKAREEEKPIPEETKPEEPTTPMQHESAEQKREQLSPDSFPDAFNLRTAKKQTKKFVDYVNSIPDADSDMISIYNSIGKMENIERNGIPFKITYGKSGHAVRMRYNGLTGKLAEVKVKIPKLDGDNITGAAQTTAHELGHYIDLLMREDASKHGGWISTRHGMSNVIDFSRRGMSDEVSDLFKKANQKIKDIRAEVKARFDARISTFRAENSAVAANAYTNYEAYRKYQKELKKMYDECEETIDYETRNQLGGINSLQDIYDALSKGAYRGNGTVTYGHGSRYYASMENQIHEIWANYCALSLTRPDLIEMLRRDKPELVAMLDKIKADIVGKVGNM